MKGGLKMTATDTKKTLILNRKLGLEKVIKGSSNWQILSGSQHCYQHDWVTDSHILTVFLWSPKIGQLIGCNEDETEFYKDQFIDFEPT